jgi:ABC-type lipoprotein export system ATPase subunit
VQPIVELVLASKIFHANGNAVYAVREANLALYPGSFTAIVGRSGCGKSTLLNLAGAVDLPTSGEVRIGGIATSRLSDGQLSRLRRTQVGFVFQFFHLLPTLTVAENVQLPFLLEARGLPPAAQQHVSALLRRVGLEHKAGSFPHQLSGGEMQRVALARALAHGPALVIADEPTGNLDSAHAETVLTLLQQSCQLQHTVLMATHSREAASFASQVIEMRDGRLLNP